VGDPGLPGRTESRLVTMRPFILIASLPRTGSTVLSEALTLPPHCYILAEPGLSRGRFSLKNVDLELFRRHGVNLRGYRRLFKVMKHAGVPALPLFKRLVMPRVGRVVEQVGAKEVRIAGWEQYHRCFPDMRVLLTGRDPRDIYLSSQDLRQRRRTPLRGPGDPPSRARRLNREFHEQLQISQTAACMKVRYEDLCSDASVLAAVKSFTGCTVPEGTAVGNINRLNPLRHAEVAAHGTALSARSVARWQRETDPQLLDEAYQMARLMPEYCEFWGYTM
jgi:hypothetical protein